MSWIHCNNCSKSDENRYFIGQCSHILCEQCVGKYTTTISCPKCHEQVGILELNAELPEELMTLFSSPVELMQQLCKATELQFSQYESLITTLKMKIDSFQKTFSDCKTKMEQ